MSAHVKARRPFDFKETAMGIRKVSILGAALFGAPAFGYASFAQLPNIDTEGSYQ